MEFFKYQATGNDFIILDDWDQQFPQSDVERIARMCHRRFGVGADGLILLRPDAGSDFEMVYFNADGKPGSMCGNGGRCAVAFAHALGRIGNQTRFRAADGLHEAHLKNGQVSLKMSDVAHLEQLPRYWFLNTGSPHHVQWVEELESLDVFKEGRRIRYSLYGETGSNVNFVTGAGPGHFRVRTYERGVEDETYSCGTGVTATVLAMHAAGRLQATSARVTTLGGDLEVQFAPDGGQGYTEIWLTGPAVQVFKGVWV